jgi:hypothetical protein
MEENFLIFFMKYLMTNYKYKLIIILICIGFFLTNCSEGSAPVSKDPISLHSYIIDNQSSALIRLKYTLSLPDLEEETYYPDIQPGVTETFFTFLSLGESARDPSYELKEVKIYTVVSETETLVYTQNPIDDSLWVCDELFDRAYSYTLTVTNPDLGL